VAAHVSFFVLSEMYQKRIQSVTWSIGTYRGVSEIESASQTKYNNRIHQVTYRIRTRTVSGAHRRVSDTYSVGY
jgi:hypothetical protein